MRDQTFQRSKVTDVELATEVQRGARSGSGSGRKCYSILAGSDQRYIDGRVVEGPWRRVYIGR